MRWKDRPKSKNVITAKEDARRYMHLMTSFAEARKPKSQRASQRFGKQGTRKTNTGRKTGGGF